MVFGVHLLANGMAKSDQEVMKILQSHVNELDGFLQRSTEDFLIIHLDVRTRIQYLSLPLGNLDVFDEMLNDRNFRLALVAYNDQIVHSIDRFTLAITDSIKDLRKGKEAMGGTLALPSSIIGCRLFSIRSSHGILQGNDGKYGGLDHCHV